MNGISNFKTDENVKRGTQYEKRDITKKGSQSS